MASKVYFADFRCPSWRENLQQKLARLMMSAGFGDIDMEGKYVAIKLHFGEPGNLAYLRPNWARAVVDLVKSHDGKPFLTDCNTLYVGGRKNALDHIESAYINGFTPYSTGCHILIADGLKGNDEVEVPVEGGEYVKSAKIGRAVMDADVFISLTHFKGHVMGGFGGSNKNISIGCADAHTGKKQLHAGATGQQWGITGREFMENMVDATKGITDHFKGHVCYVNVLRRMSVDCDCAGTSAEAPRVPDIGIFASLDLLAVEQASVDAVYDLGEASAPLRERIESRHGLRQLSAMREIGLGSENYEIVDLDKA